MLSAPAEWRELPRDVAVRLGYAAYHWRWEPGGDAVVTLRRPSLSEHDVRVPVAMVNDVDCDVWAYICGVLAGPVNTCG